ncbi:gamma-glutamyl hydrolase A-like isoform X2 [Pieris napi]|uniref:gamma-glutamyl hydrolase A-like isoform X2 n=1 Tax=Pieris napi TaxID=78633 RepID=UPI001FBB3FF2|nr:gamma-glutamyl hydrolase A-like isoform X2 [Pieris napi]
MHVRYKSSLYNIKICVFNDVTSVIFIWLVGGSPEGWLEMLTIKALILTAYVYYCEGTSRAALNDRPIIGVLSQEQSKHLHSKFPDENYTSYIAASYVKHVEAAGARVVPILIGKNRKYYEDLMKKINGVFLPGGATFFNQSNGFADAGQHIYEIAQEMNRSGDYFPIFGTCLGFELLIILASGRGEKENRVKCYSFRNLSLNFTKDFRSSKMFKDATEDIIRILETEDITVNAHQFCILDENLKSHNLTKDWRVTSHSKDDNGTSFIATIEHTRYPFYGVQFHPEKIAYEWKASKNYPHTMNALHTNRYFMDFFVSECRKNNHRFPSTKEENDYLIYKYVPVFTGELGSSYQQCYFFEPRGVDTKYNLDLLKDKHDSYYRTDLY